MAEHEVNLNNADVIKDESHLGFTIHHNISKGSMVRVPWGGLDWLGFVAGSLFALAFLTLLGVFAVAVMSSIRW